jgi:hypothetical protein
MVKIGFSKLTLTLTLFLFLFANAGCQTFEHRGPSMSSDSHQCYEDCKNAEDCANDNSPRTCRTTCFDGCYTDNPAQKVVTP